MRNLFLRNTGVKSHYAIDELGVSQASCLKPCVSKAQLKSRLSS